MDEKYIQDSLQKISLAETIHELIHVVKPSLFGSGSLIENLGKELKTSSQEQKKEIGKRIAQIRNIFESEISNKMFALEEVEIMKKLSAQKIDGTLPSRAFEIGQIHPVTKVANEVIDIFKIYGFELKSGFEIENDWYNFTALNIPEHHPARQMHDTFYLGKNLLRTHTTSVDVRALEKIKGPAKLMSFGKTFRCDSDKTHSPMFHQFELVEIGEKLTMSDLKGYMMSFLKIFFGKENIQIRLRPSFFPFTEPSAEVDIGYCVKNGKIIVGEECDNFMEILGCGMLHENVLKNCNIDSNIYNGIAFGMGVERMAMLKYGIDDLRKFFESDIKWLKYNA